MDFEFDDDLEDEFDTVTMTDEETGENIEFAVIDKLEHKGNSYLLVVETELMEDDETDAVILKKVGSTENDLTYALVEDDNEFNIVADIFQKNSGENYDVDIED